MKTFKTTIYISIVILSVVFLGCKSENTVMDSKNNPKSKNENNYFKYDLKGKWSSNDGKMRLDIYDKIYVTYFSIPDTLKEIWDYEIDYNILRIFNPYYNQMSAYAGSGIKNIDIDIALKYYPFDNFAKQRTDFIQIIDNNNIEGTVRKYKKDKGL